MMKSTIIAAVKKHQENLVNELSERINLSHSMVDLDENDTIDPEDFSHQTEAGEMEQHMRVKYTEAKRLLEQLEQIDFSPKDAANQGAYVETDQFNCLIGISTAPFEHDGKSIVGMSTESPIYSSMKGKQVNESFHFGGREYHIRNIL